MNGKVAKKGTAGDDLLGRAHYSAVQMRSGVRIVAVGVNSTPGYRNLLERTPLDVFPPEHRFLSIPPEGQVIQIPTRFDVMTEFSAMVDVAEVVVHDRDGRHAVPVQELHEALSYLDRDPGDVWPMRHAMGGGMPFPVVGKDGPFPMRTMGGDMPFPLGSDWLPWPWAALDDVLPWPWRSGGRAHAEMVAVANATAAAAATKPWAAWIDAMPPGPRRLHVVGDVIVGNPGIVCHLTQRVPQGINPAILMLDLHRQQRPGYWPQVVSSARVTFERLLKPGEAVSGVEIYSNQQKVATIDDVPVVH